MAIKADQERVEDVLRGRKQYVIPDYQRPYVWSWDQAQDLVEDMRAAWERGDNDFFLGSIVVIRGEGEAVAEVVDGQQRLTTLAIFFAVVRELADERLKPGLGQYLTTEADLVRQIEPQPRVVVRQVDRDFFDAHIVAGDVLGLRAQATGSLGTEGQRNMRRSLDAIWETLSDFEEPEQLRSFLGFVLSVSLIVVETDNFQNAHRIFGVLNTRGVPLAAADVFKAKILGEVPEEDREVYAEKWDDALRPMEADPDAFFRHLLVSVTKTSPRRALTEAFEDAIGTRLLGEIGACRFIDEKLVPLADAYGTVEASLQDDVAETLDLLHDHHSQEWKPVAMWVVENVKDTHERDRLLRGLDRVLGLHTMAGSTKTARAEAMTTLLQRFENARIAGLGAVPAAAFDVPDAVLYNAIAALHGMLPRSAKRPMLLRRAHWEAVGPAGMMPSDSTWVSVFPQNPVPEMDAKTDVNDWRSRLGSMVLSKTSNARVKRAASWEEVCALASPGNPARESAATTLQPDAPPSEETLRRRQQDLIALVVRFWSAQFDSNGMDLLRLDESQLLEYAGRGRVARSRPTQLADVLRFALLGPGETLVWERPNKKQRFEVRVTEDGKLRLPDGSLADSPSGAAKAVSGSSASGIDVWRRQSDGVGLRELWNNYEKRFSHRGGAPSRSPAPPARSSRLATAPTAAPSDPVSSSASRSEKSVRSIPKRPSPRPPIPKPPSRLQASPETAVGRAGGPPQEPPIAGKTQVPGTNQSPGESRAQGGLGPLAARSHLWGRSEKQLAAEEEKTQNGSLEEQPGGPQSIRTNIDEFQKTLGPLGAELTRTKRGWIWNTVASNSLMRQRSSLIPAGLAKALGVGPGQTRVFLTPNGESIAVQWDDMGPSIGDVRRLLIRNRVLRRDRVSLSFLDEGQMEVHSMSEAEHVDSEDSAANLDSTMKRVPGRHTTPVKWTMRCLDLIGAEYEDRRGRGGALWVFGGDEIAPVILAANASGAGFEYAEKVRSGKPGWWTKRKR